MPQAVKKELQVELTNKVRAIALEVMEGKYKGSSDLSAEIQKRLSSEEMSHVVVNYIMEEVSANPLAMLMAALAKGE